MGKSEVELPAKVEEVMGVPKLCVFAPQFSLPESAWKDRLACRSLSGLGCLWGQQQMGAH